MAFNKSELYSFFSWQQVYQPPVPIPDGAALDNDDYKQLMWEVQGVTYTAPAVAPVRKWAMGFLSE